MLFSGLEGSELDEALRFFEARVMKYRRGEILNRLGEPLPYFGLVLEGQVQVLTDDIEGNRMIMAGVGPGGTFGESLCLLGRDAYIYIRAVTDITVLRMTASHVNKRPGTDSSVMLSGRFASMLAVRTLNMNNRIQILSKLSIRDKIITFLSQYADKQEQISSETKIRVEVPFDREDMAVYLGTNRSALSRELSAMKRDGLLDYRRNVFVISTGAQQ